MSDIDDQLRALTESVRDAHGVWLVDNGVASGLSSAERDAIAARGHALDATRVHAAHQDFASVFDVCASGGDYSSYGAKHTLEAARRHILHGGGGSVNGNPYLTNGQFIAAALLGGAHIVDVREPNALMNIDTRADVRRRLVAHGVIA